MYEDDTIRLFGVANILRNKKDNTDNWRRDDIPDLKREPFTGKYDNNFDAPGFDYVKDTHYNLRNIDQPENTKSDIKTDDKYTRFLNYTPSKYVQLEEQEYRPFNKYNEKADEYYIDNLQGKTFDDMVISKMKENAGAGDLDPRASRLRFADNLANEQIQKAAEEDKLFDGGLSMFGNMQEEVADNEFPLPNSKRKKKHKEEKDRVVIEPVANSRKKNRQVHYEEEEKQEGGGAVQPSPAKSKQKTRSGLDYTVPNQKEREIEEKEKKYREIEEKRAKILQTKKQEEAEEKRIEDENKTGADKSNLKRGFKKLKENATKNKESSENVKYTEATKANLRKGFDTLAKATAQKKGERRNVEWIDNNRQMGQKSNALSQLQQNVQIEKQIKEKRKEKALGNLLQKGASSPSLSEVATTIEGTEPASYFAGGGALTNSDIEQDIPVKGRGKHPNTQIGLDRHRQAQNQSKLAEFQKLKEGYTESKSTVDIELTKEERKKYNDLNPQTKATNSNSKTKGDLLKLIENEEKRRMPSKPLTKAALKQSDEARMPEEIDA